MARSLREELGPCPAKTPGVARVCLNRLARRSPARADPGTLDIVLRAAADDRIALCQRRSHGDQAALPNDLLDSHFYERIPAPHPHILTIATLHDARRRHP